MVAPRNPGRVAPGRQRDDGPQQVTTDLHHREEQHGGAESHHGAADGMQPAPNTANNSQVTQDCDDDHTDAAGQGPSTAVVWSPSPSRMPT